MVQFQLDKPDNLLELLEKSVKRFPDRPFLGTKNNLPDNIQTLVDRENVQSMITNEIMDALKGKYGRYEIPKKLFFLSEPFTLENEMLTQTMKLKRRTITEEYNERIENLYN